MEKRAEQEGALAPITRPDELGILVTLTVAIAKARGRLSDLAFSFMNA